MEALSYQKWAEAEIMGLQIQPLKGGGSCHLLEARLTPSGLETVKGSVQDHSLFVVTGQPGEKGYHHFLTQRLQVDPNKNLYVPGDPRLALFKPNIREGRLSFLYGKDFVVDPENLPCFDKKIVPVQLWEYWGKAVEVPILSQFASDELHRAVKVVRTADPWDRLARQNFIANENPLRAQDGYPVHTIMWSDVEAVFQALKVPVDPSRFRYQILLEGLGFREIHRYARALIGGRYIDQAKPCDRCEVTGRDQLTGELSEVKPLSGLAMLAGRWLRSDNGRKLQIFGENWLPKINEGRNIVIQVGDKVAFTHLRTPALEFEEVKSRKTPPQG